MLRQFTKNYDSLNVDYFLIIQSTQSDARDLCSGFGNGGRECGEVYLQPHFFGVRGNNAECPSFYPSCPACVIWRNPSFRLKI